MIKDKKIQDLLQLFIDGKDLTINEQEDLILQIDKLIIYYNKNRVWGDELDLLLYNVKFELFKQISKNKITKDKIKYIYVIIYRLTKFKTTDILRKKYLRKDLNIVNFASLGTIKEKYILNNYTDDFVYLDDSDIEDVLKNYVENKIDKNDNYYDD